MWMCLWESVDRTLTYNNKCKIKTISKSNWTLSMARYNYNQCAIHKIILQKFKTKKKRRNTKQLTKKKKKKKKKQAATWLLDFYILYWSTLFVLNLIISIYYYEYKWQRKSKKMKAFNNVSPMERWILLIMSNKKKTANTHTLVSGMNMKIQQDIEAIK